MAATKSLSQKDMNGQKIVNTGDGTASGDVATKGQLDAGVTDAKSRATHTGTQTAATISDFNTAARLNKLNQFAAPDSAVAFGGQQITGLADGTVSTHAATKGQLDAAIAALSGGLAFKGAARVATTANITLATPGATIDGVAPTSGDVVLLTGQSTGSQNGPYVWTGSAAALTRPPNWDSAGEAVPGSMWIVQQGTFDNQLAILSNDTFVLNTTTGTFVFLNPASAADNDTGYTAVCPAVSAGATWTVTHSLGSKAVIVQVYRTGSPFDDVDVYFTRSDTNTVLLMPDIAMAAGEFTVVVSKVV